MDMNKTCMIIIGAVGGVALLAILAAIAFCIAFVIFYRKAVNAGVVPGVARVVTPVEKKAIAANNAILVDWKQKAISLETPITDFAYRGRRISKTVHGDVGIIFGDIQTGRTQNPALTTSAISKILDLWLQYGPNGPNAIASNGLDFRAKISDFFAIDAVKKAAAGLPDYQVRIFIDVLSKVSDAPLLNRQNAVNLCNANFALRSANSLLAALRFANNASFCTIGVSEFDDNMKTVSANLTQTNRLLSKIRNAYNLPAATYPIYGDAPEQLLPYTRPEEAKKDTAAAPTTTPSATSPTAASSSESLPTPQQQQPSS